MIAPWKMPEFYEKYAGRTALFDYAKVCMFLIVKLYNLYSTRCKLGGIPFCILHSMSLRGKLDKTLKH